MSLSLFPAPFLMLAVNIVLSKRDLQDPRKCQMGVGGQSVIPTLRWQRQNHQCKLAVGLIKLASLGSAEHASAYVRWRVGEGDSGINL